MSNKIQVPPTHYFNLDYDTKERWISYWYQIKEVLNLRPKNVLEIGVGNKTVSDYLKKIGIKVVTCDFDKSLSPDVVADILRLPFNQNSFDLVLCAEVLEHLPFRNFSKALVQIYKITKNNAVITLPHFSLTNLYFGLKLIPFIPKIELNLKIDFPIKHRFQKEHYWEIGKSGHSLAKVMHQIQRSGFSIERTYYPKENPRHHFFILNKKIPAFISPVMRVRPNRLERGTESSEKKRTPSVRTGRSILQK